MTRIAKEEGRGFLWWSTKAGNEAARAFYARLGAEEEGSRSHALVGEAFELLATEGSLTALRAETARLLSDPSASVDAFLAERRPSRPARRGRGPR